MIVTASRFAEINWLLFQTFSSFLEKLSSLCKYRAYVWSLYLTADISIRASRSTICSNS